MQSHDDLDSRFGSDAARRLARLLGPPPPGDPSFSPASRERCLGALTGAVAAESLPWILKGKSSALGPDTRLTLITADSVLSGAHDHPVRFAARLATTHIRGAGRAAHHTRDALRSGVAWWLAGAANSAGAAAAARSTAFGLLWSADPRRAAYEAALSASVTHGHPAAIAGATAIAAAVALAARGEGPLDGQWLTDIADICDDYKQGSVYGATVADRIRLLPSLLDAGLDDALDRIGSSPLATEAVPAALLTAALAPTPVTRAFEEGASSWDPRLIAGLHQASRTMMGACIGARHGEDAWLRRDGTARPSALPPDAFTRVRDINNVRHVADRIAGRRIRPSEVPPAERPDADEGTILPVHISFLIDRSGSMAPLRSDVVDGFNAFVAEQREKSGDCVLTLVQFDSNDPFEVVHEAVPVAKVPDLAPNQYRPRGATPLLDALGTLIETADARLKSVGREEDQIVAIFTDGLENASRKWSRDRLFEVITERKNAGWTFVFMGANQDSYAEAGRLGMDVGSVQDFRASDVGVRAAFGSFGRAVGEYRGAGYAQRRERREGFFGGRKEAEEGE